jgi:hypothetical protein
MADVFDSHPELARLLRNAWKRESIDRDKSRSIEIRSSKTTRGESASSISGSLTPE